MKSVPFALTVFLSAVLTFTVQPLVGKQLLPLVGGTPAVWTTCLLFFQAVLLAGYVLTNLLTRFGGPRRQLAVQLVAIAVAGGLLVGVGLKPWGQAVPAGSENPAAAVLLVLLGTVGGPFLVLSMTAPLVQAWFARSGRNPYPLYAASNFGSFVGLLGYPLVVEPGLPITEQRFDWSVGFAVWAGLLLVCGLIAGTRQPPTDGIPQPSQPPTRGRVLRWIGLAALPSSLLMSVSTHVTTDVAPVPLLWVLPLGLYLLSFVVVFSYWPTWARLFLGRITPMALCFLAVALLTRADTPMIAVASVHLFAFFLVALLSHGELAADRPAADRLTQFFVWVAVGGVVGGVLTAVVAPIVFARLGPLEYPLAVVLAGLVRPPTGAVGVTTKRSDGYWPLGLGVFTGLLVFGVPELFGEPPLDGSPGEEVDRWLRGGLSFGIPSVAAFALVWRPVRFALCLAAVLAVGSFAPSRHGDVLETHRNYFGTLRVTRSRTTVGEFIRIFHGTTLHGQQRTDDRDRPQPATYYHRTGPLGSVFAGLPKDRRRRVGVVGLGGGAAAAYADPGSHWTFYEIDPAVVRIATSEQYFTFLSTCQGTWDIIIGDARRQLENAGDGEFDLLLLDAFSSDAIPVHLLTVEAFRGYLRTLGPRGVLAVHVSNRYLDLTPLLARLGAAADPPMVVASWDDVNISDTDRTTGKEKSTWVVLARAEADLPTKPDGRPDPRWNRVRPEPGPVWTDEFSNLLAVWKRD
jgi:hypothetical protein